MTHLKGMTWSHPRGVDPLMAASDAWARTTGVRVTWDKRSLQDFESYPVDELARRYDLIVIDHPHVGQVTAEGCLLALPEAPDIAKGSLGRSFESYIWGGRQWAWPIDAAAQVQAIRSDLGAPVTDWDHVVAMARRGQVAIPLRPPHVLMSFFTLCANIGHPCRHEPDQDFVDRVAGVSVLEKLRALADHVDPVCFEQDPIQVLGDMATGDRIRCVPLIYGYISYALADAKGHRITFHDIPEALAGRGPSGSALGGTGIAVSAQSSDPEAAIAFARYVAGPEAQVDLWTFAGGQAGHRAAWLSPEADEAAGAFYSGTLHTLDAAWMRPRHNGYMGFQNPASDRINDALKTGRLDTAIDDLNDLFRESFAL